MSTIRISKKALFFFFYLAKYRSINLAYLFSYFNVSEKDVEGLKFKNGLLEVINNGNKISISHLPTFGFSMTMLIRLLKSNRIKILDCQSSFFIAQTGDMTFKVQSLSNMAVLYEIFVENIYSFATSKKDLIVVDIGMNVGLASMYFASKSNVLHVYGYEPFPETYHEATSNFSLNPNIFEKVSLINAGVSDISEFRKIYLFESGLLSASTIDTINHYGKIKDTFVEVKLISIKSVLDMVKLNHPNKPILMKIDCEGEEYAIFEALKNSDYFNNVDCIMVEWHENGYCNIESILLNNQFQIYHKYHVSENSGMIYAYKSF